MRKQNNRKTYALWNKFTKDQFVKDYTEFGTQFVIDKYNISSRNMVYILNRRYREELGLPRISNSPAYVTTRWDNEIKLQFLNDYQILTPSELSKKYNIGFTTIADYHSKFKKDLKLV